MLPRAIALTVSLAVVAVPGMAQEDHRHDHIQDPEKTPRSAPTMHETMSPCPFSEPVGMHSGVMGMTHHGMMDEVTDGMRNHGMMGGGIDTLTGEALSSETNPMVEAHLAVARSTFEVESLHTPGQREMASGSTCGPHDQGMMGGGMTTGRLGGQGWESVQRHQ